MTKAIIIFADGSKQMAHNLDDSKERWYERKVAQAEEVYEEVRNLSQIAIIDASDPKDYDQATSWQSQLISMKVAITNRRSLLKEKWAYRKENDFLLAVYREIEGQLGVIKGPLKKFTIELANTGRASELKSKGAIAVGENKELINSLIVAQAEIIRLQKLLIEQFGLPESVVMLNRKAS